MKKHLLIIILLLLANAKISADVKPRFFISTSAAGDSSGKLAEAYLGYFETQIFNLIKTTYPCAELNSLSTVKALLNHERQKQLLGSGDDNAVQNIAQSFGCDYLISLKVSVINNTALITALCMDNKKAETLSRAFASVQHGSAAVDAVVDVSEKLFDGLKEYEICPFKGPVKVHVISTIKDKQEEEYSVYCNKTDGTYRKITTIDNYADNDWDLKKTGKNMTTGSIKFSMHEETTVEEQDACHKCSSGHEGGRIYYEKKTSTADVQGLSNESQSYGIQVDDARVAISFSEDGTYTIWVKATSKQGDLKLRTEKHAEGTCDNIPNKPESIEKKADVPLNTIFGPFKGNAQDKVLAQKDTIKKIDPVSKEESIIEYEFNLKTD